MLSSLKNIDLPKHVSYAVFSCLISFLISFIWSTHVLAQNDSIRFDIPSQTVQSALDTFVAVTNFSLIYNKEGFGDVITSAVSGQYSPEQALDIMLEGTGLMFEFTSQDTVAILKNGDQPIENLGGLQEIQSDSQTNEKAPKE